MKKRVIRSFLLVFVCTILGACSGSNGSIDFDDKGFAKSLLVEKIENDSVVEESTKKITDTSEIKKILDMVDGMDVQAADEDAFEIMKSNKDGVSYNFAFFKDKTEMGAGEEVPYVFYTLGDGTFIFLYDDVHSVRDRPLISDEKHKGVLKKMKNVLGIDF